jgi:hypothetical protein
MPDTLLIIEDEPLRAQSREFVGSGWDAALAFAQAERPLFTRKWQKRQPEGRLPFDLRPCHGASLDDLDLSLPGMDYAAERSADQDGESFPDLEVWLGQRELARRTAAGWAPTTTGILVYGIDPQAHFPGAIVEFVRYTGTELDAPVASRKTAILDRVRDCFASLWQDRAIASRRKQGFSQRDAAMAVVVQRMVCCEVAGVGFTVNPVSGALDEMLVSVCRGRLGWCQEQRASPARGDGVRRSSDR